eukprot:Sro77_g042140.2  (539) ;mRNA; r:77166-78782
MATFPHCSENRTVSTIPGRSGVPDAVALSQFRWMHQLYMMDPDLRDARAKHPFIVQFDNHDLGDDYPSLATHKGSAKAGYEWVPQRVNLIRDDDGELTDVETFRHFPLGQDNLFDLILLDTGAYMGNYSYKETHGLLGQGQRAWLQQVLTNSSSSNSQWRVIASGKAFMPLTLNKLGQAVIKSSAMVFLFPLGILSLLVALQVCLHRRRRRRLSANDKTSFRQRTRSIEMDLLANSRQGEAAAYDVGVGDDETEELVTGGDHKDENYEEEEEEDTDDASSEEESVPLSPTRGGGGTDNPNPPQRRRSGRKPRTNKEMLCEAHEESPLLLRCTATFCRGITIAWPVFFMIVAILVRKLAMKGDGLFLFDNSPVVWTGNHESTIHLFDLLDETNTDSNNLWVTGDEHLCYASDVFRYNPYERDILHYNPNDDSNTTRYGVEMLPCSGTRGNLDEMAGSILGPLFHPRGMLSFLSKFILHDAVVLINRHFRYFNGDDHGYGLVKVTREQITATFYFFPILEVTNKHNTKTMVVRDGGNKWE